MAQRAALTPESDVIVGDCVEVMRGMEPDSIDAIVTDPPYDLTAGKKGGSGIASLNENSPAGRSRATTGFMGKSWDGTGVAFDGATWAEALRVMKPGAHLVAFGAPRTYHRMTVAIEDAGFEIRDCLSWLFGSGFPKSLDVSKAIDKAAGAEREQVAAVGGLTANRLLNDDGWGKIGSEAPTMAGPVPATDLACLWDGWGTALKPGWEPCVVARKPLIGTVAANVTQYGTGALNIDACRIETDERPARIADRRGAGYGIYRDGLQGSRAVGSTTEGRWPANVALDEEAAAMLDAQSGERASGSAHVLRRGGTTGKGMGYHSSAEGNVLEATYGDTGGASRFYYTAKASRSEREAWGRMMLPAERRTDGREKDIENPRLRTSKRVNDHPTVKPLALMEWLIKLVTPEGGIVLDPFAGSGSTLVAARKLNVRAIGIEQDERSAEIARQRIAAQWEVALL